MCILFLHAALLGIDFDSKIFRSLRKLIIALFIVFEVAAQILLTQNLYKFRDKLALKNKLYPILYLIVVF